MFATILNVASKGKHDDEHRKPHDLPQMDLIEMDVPEVDVTQVDLEAYKRA
jgi:hypothetical protein